jgi:circadian clock protein KaiC
MAYARQIASTGISGLDDVLDGGFTANRLYLVEGMPGSGKTTLALQFLIAGARRGEPVLYITLSETEEELREIAASHGWSLDGVTIQQFVPDEGSLDADEQSTMFHPSEVELAETTARILAEVERTGATSLVLDSLSEMRLLAGHPLRYRRQILALKQYFAARQCTVLLLDDLTATDHDLQVQSISHAVLMLEQLHPEFGAERRRLRVIKFRGVKYRGGFHDYTIKPGGLEVYPRLVAAEHRDDQPVRRLPSGVDELDALLGGGVEEGTSTLLVGPPGTGKSTIAAQFAASLSGKDEKAAIFTFDESPRTLISRAASLNIDLASAVESGNVTIRQVDPAELTPGELIHTIRNAVEHDGVSLVVLDSLNGYMNAMPEERFLLVQLHELLSYLGQKSVATILIGAHHGLIGGNMSTPIEASYLADSIVLLRYFEMQGEVRQAISVLKKRGGNHERTIREVSFSDGHMKVGEVLRHFRGILTGVPVLDPTNVQAPKQAEL